MIVAVAALFAACTPEKKATYARLGRAYDGFKQKYPGEEVDVNRHNYRELSIAFTNSPLNGHDRLAQGRRAEEAAELAVRLLETGEVEGRVWFRQRGIFLGLAQVTTNAASYGFTADSSGHVRLKDR